MATTTPRLGLPRPEASDNVTLANDQALIDAIDTGAETPAGAQAKANAVQTNLNTHTAATTGVHGATSAATASKIAIRDAAGRMKAAAPAAADDVARKDTVDAHANRTDNPHATTAAQVGAETPAGAQAKADEVQDNLGFHSNDVGAHSATPAASGSRIVLRDPNGRAKVAAPGAADDIARKDTVDNAVTDGMSRQAFINGNFDVWQRALSVNDPSTGQYLCDHFQTLLSNSGTLPGITHSRGTLLPGELLGSSFYYRINPDAAGSGFGANDFYQIRQHIENGTRYLCGAGKKVTLSFYAKSGIVGKKIGVYLAQTYGFGGSFSPSESVAGTAFALTGSWQKFTFTFTTNTLTGKTFGTNNDDALVVNFAVMWGSSYGERFGSAVSESFGGSGLIDIAQVQVNAGDAALPFQPRSFGEELALCQRYYEKSSAYDQAAGTGDFVTIHAASVPNAKASSDYPFKVWKRIPPTMKIYDSTTYTLGNARWFLQGTGGVNLLSTAASNESNFNVTSTATDSTAATQVKLAFEADAEF